MGVTSIRLSKDVEIPLEKLAKKLDRSKNYLVNQAIKEFVLRQSMEELRWTDTVEALESVEAGRLWRPGTRMPQDTSQPNCWMGLVAWRAFPLGLPVRRAPDPRLIRDLFVGTHAVRYLREESSIIMLRIWYGKESEKYT